MTSYILIHYYTTYEYVSLYILFSYNMYDEWIKNSLSTTLTLDQADPKLISVLSIAHVCNKKHTWDNKKDMYIVLHQYLPVI